MKRIFLGLLLVACLGLVVGFLYASGGSLRELRNFSSAIALGLVFSLPYGFGHSEGIRLLLGLRLAMRERLRFFWVQQASGLVGTIAAPQLGIPARLLMVKQFFGVPIGRGTGAIVVEILLQFQIMFLFLTIPAPLLWGERSAWVAAAFGASALMLAGAIWLFRRGLLAAFLERAELSRWPRCEGLLSTAEAAIRNTTARQLAGSAAWFAFCFLVDGVCLAFFLWQGGASVSVLTLIQAGILTYVLSAASMIPFGAGVRDVGFIVILGWMGVPASLAALAALYQRFLRTFVPLALGAFATGLLGIEGISRSSGSAEVESR